MFSLNDITSQLQSLFGGGGAQTFAAPDTMAGMTATGGLSGSNALQTFGGAGAGAGAAGLGGIAGLGANMPTLGLALGGFQALNGLLQGNKAFGLANKQFKFQKDVTNTNLNNQIQSYNTALEDRLRSRGVTEGTDSATVESNIERNRLRR